MTDTSANMLGDDQFAKHAPSIAPSTSKGGQAAFFSAWDIHAYYGESYIVQGISFDIREGEIVALLGRNGAGKTSTLRAIARVDDPFGRSGARGRSRDTAAPAGDTLPAGLFVEASIQGRRVESAYVIPREALREGRTVFLVEEAKLARRDVEVIRVLDDTAIIRGLPEGALLCISNPAVAVDGMVVRTDAGETP